MSSNKPYSIHGLCFCKNQIELDLTEIFQFGLKFCDLLRHPMGECIAGLIGSHVKSLKID